MTDTTQPKPGRALNERMAEIMGWQNQGQLYHAFDERMPQVVRQIDVSRVEFPCIAIHNIGEELRVLKYDIPNLGIEWNPSTRIADAFEVMNSHEEWRWTFGETEGELSICLIIPKPVYITVFWADFTDPDGTRNRPEAYSFGICWAALAWLEGQG